MDYCIIDTGSLYCSLPPTSTTDPFGREGLIASSTEPV